jgi:hypothetical protein
VRRPMTSIAVHAYSRTAYLTYSQFNFILKKILQINGKLKHIQGFRGK